MSITKPDLSHWPENVQRMLEERPATIVTVSPLWEGLRRQTLGFDKEIAAAEEGKRERLQAMRNRQAAMYVQYFQVSVENGSQLFDDAQAMLEYNRATKPPLEYSDDFLD